MTDQPQPSLGTVAEEAARLIAAMATLTRSSAVPGDHDPYAGGPAQEPWAPDTDESPRPEDSGRPKDAPPGQDSSAGPQPASHGAARACSSCGGESDGTPAACRLCPVCQGIALLRSVRPETVDRLADLASAMAASLRDMATQSRASGATSAGRSPSQGGAGERATVQDIRVDDESEG